MKKLFLLLWLLLLPAVHTAGQQLSSPLQYVPLDSVWVMPYYNPQRLARGFEGDTTQHLRTFTDMERMSRRQFRQALERWNIRLRDSLNLVGGVGDESYGALQFDAARATVINGAALFRETADATFMDAVEAALYNAVEATLSGYFQPAHTQAAARLVFASYSLRYATDEDGVYVNLFSNSTVRVNTPRFRMVIDQVTDMPYLRRVTLRIMQSSASEPLKIRVRLPMWAAGRSLSARYRMLNPEQLPTLYVNGHATEYAVERGYAVVERKWMRGDEIYWDFNLAPRLVAQDARSGQAAVQWGPLIYAMGVDLEAGQRLVVDSIRPDYRASFMRLMGPGLPPAGGKPQPLLLLPYAESFTWQGYTSVWMPVAEPAAKPADSE